MKAIAKSPPTLAERVKLLMEVREWGRQEDLAEAAGIKQSSLSDLLRGVTTPEKVRASTLSKLAAALGTTSDYLLEGAIADTMLQGMEEAELLAIYRKVDASARLAILQSARTVLHAAEMAATAQKSIDKSTAGEKALAQFSLRRQRSKPASKKRT